WVAAIATLPRPGSWGHPPHQTLALRPNHASVTASITASPVSAVGITDGPTAVTAIPINGAVATGPRFAAATATDVTCSALRGNAAVNHASPVGKIGANAKPTRT